MRNKRTMKILNIHTAYNELFLLKYKYEYCKHYGLDLFVIDNMSNDGSKEFMEEHDIAHSFIDTGGAFDLRPLIKATNDKIRELKPDWFIYSGVDMFYESENGIRKDIEDCNAANNVNAIITDIYSIRFVGENIREPFKNFYATKGLTNIFIAKYAPYIFISPDKINGITGSVVSGGTFFEIHATKTPEERRETYERRKLAWERGMNKAWGTHYTAFDTINWTFNKLNAINLSNNVLYQKLGSLFE